MESNEVEEAEIGIAPLLAPHAEKIQHPVLFIDYQQLSDIPVAVGDLPLDLAGFEVAQVEMSPIVSLREPDQLARSRKITPIHASVSRFEEGRHLFIQPFPNCARGSVCHTKALLLVVARCRDERQMRAVRAPLHVSPLRAAASKALAERESALLRG